MSRLDTLKESRQKAADALSAHLAILELVSTGDEASGLEPRAWSSEEETRLNDLEAQVKQFDTLVGRAETEEREADNQLENRDRLLGPASGLDVRVGDEPTTYGPANPRNSWVRDKLYASDPTNINASAAIERLKRHGQEMAGIVRSNPASKEARAINRYDLESRRLQGDPEHRAVSTAATSMGSEAPPLYFLKDTAPYRTYGRTLIDALRSYPMPETGMLFNVPRITTPTQSKTQATQNTTISTRTMVSSYETGTLHTQVDNLNVSQQYLDRVGPGISGDQIVQDDQSRQMNRTLNVYAWKTIFSNGSVGTVTYGTTSFTAAKFLKTGVGKAKSTIQKTDGTVAYPTHIISTVDLWETIEGSYDTNKRPYVVPQGVAFNPLAVGDRDNVPEGYTGFRLRGLPAFVDQASFVSWQTVKTATATEKTWNPLLVGALDIAAYWLEGAPVVRVLPQPNAAQLTVLMQTYVYCALIIVYPSALQIIRGAGTKATKLV